MADSARPWVKVWESWWKSRSHDDLDADALLVGLRLLSVAQAAPQSDEETRWCLTPGGEPKSHRALARECRVSPSRVGSAIRSLLKVGTLVERRTDGAVGFPKWDQYQLSPSALRMRRHRARTQHVTDGVTVTGDVDDKRTEDRGQKNKPPNPRKRGRRSEPKGREARSDLVEQANAVLDRLNERRAWIAERYSLGPQSTFTHCKTHRAEILRLLDEDKPELGQVLAVVDAAAREVAIEHGEGIQYLNPTTPFRAKNWPRYLAKVGAKVNGKSHAPDPSIETVEQARAWADEHGGQAPPGWRWNPDFELEPQEAAP